MAGWNEMLRAARARLGLSQQQLAERAGVSLRTVNAYLRGVERPGVDTLLKLASGLDLDRPTVNAVLTDAGFDSLPTGRLRWFERRSVPIEAMQQEVDGYSWPCLVMSDAMEILLWNAPATWVAELDFAVALPEPAQRHLLRIATMPHFSSARVLNWDHVIGQMVAMLKADFSEPDVYADALPWFGKLILELNDDPARHAALQRVLQMWGEVQPRNDLARSSFVAIWQLSSGPRLRLNCVISSWNEFEAAWAFDWQPADGTTADWLRDRWTANEHGATADSIVRANGASPPALPAWNVLLRSARERSALTQAELARAARVSVDAISSYERDRRRPSRSVLRRIARALMLDGATANLLLAGVGFEPEPSALASSIAGQPTPDPRFWPERWSTLAEQTRALLPERIQGHPWPCLVLDSQCRIVAVNDVAKRLLGTATRHPDLLQLLLSPELRTSVVNYDEMASALAPSGLKEAAKATNEDTRSAPFHAALRGLASEDAMAAARLRDLWEAGQSQRTSTRATFPVVWRTLDDHILNFNSTIGLWSDYLRYWALDLHPSDAASWAWFTPETAEMRNTVRM